MAEEIQEAVQIIRVAYDGIEIAMKVGSGGIAAMQKAIDFLKGILKEGGVIGIIEIPGLDIRCPVMEGTMRFVVRCIYKEVVMDE